MIRQILLVMLVLMATLLVYQFIIKEPSPPLSYARSSQRLFINEIMPNGKPDWVEIYNPTDTALALAGFSLADNSKQPYRFPDHTVIPARGFLVIECSDSVTGFKLSAGKGDKLFLFDRANLLVDIRIINPAPKDVTQARVPDGSENWVTSGHPSLGKNNRAAEASASAGLRRLTIGPTDISGLSGLAFNPRTNTLFAVQDGPYGTIYELDLSGRVITTTTIAASDLEDVAYDATNQALYLVEERQSVIVRYDLMSKTSTRLAVDISREDANLGLEGIAVDSKRGIIYVANEKKPRIIMELDREGRILNRTEIGFSKDISGLCFDERNNGLWMLSSESKKLYRLNERKEIVAEYDIDAERAEGITVDGGGNLYLIDEQTSDLHHYAIE